MNPTKYTVKHVYEFADFKNLLIREMGYEDDRAWRDISGDGPDNWILLLEHFLPDNFSNDSYISMYPHDPEPCEYTKELYENSAWTEQLYKIHNALTTIYAKYYKVSIDEEILFWVCW